MSNVNVNEFAVILDGKQVTDGDIVEFEIREDGILGFLNGVEGCNKQLPKPVAEA